MSNITINGKELVIKEIKHERVVSSYDIAKLHEKEVREVNQQFERNKKYLIEGEDYIEIDRKTFESQFVIQEFIPNNVKTVKLFTEQGYLMLAKAFNGDVAWKVQRELVNTYFKAKQIQTTYFDMSQLSPELQMFKQIFDSVATQQLELKEYKEKQVELESALYEQSKNIQALNTVIQVEDNTTQRQLFVESVKKLAYKWRKPHGKVYSYIYRIINHNENVNIQSRASNRKVKAIDVLESDGYLEYALRVVNKAMEYDRIPEDV